MPALKIRNLRKIYKGVKGGPDKVALDDVCLEVPRGSCFGLLGPNGAGKSTLINIVAGITNKTSGEVKICGYDLLKNSYNAKQSVGVVPQELLIDPFFSPYEVLEIFAGLYGIPKNKRRTDELISAMDLTSVAHLSGRKLSGGMKRRMMVARAMVHSPPFIILDEPTAGVDVELRERIWDYMKDLNDSGTTILLTTHYLEEAERLCDKIAIINEGKIIINDDKKNIKNIISRKKLIITTNKAIKNIPGDVASMLGADGGISINKKNLEISYSPNRINAGEIISAVSKSDINIVDITTEETTLEEIFRYLTRKED